MEQMVIFRKILIFLCLCMAGIRVNGQELKNYKDTQLKFEIVSSRLMTSEESLRKQSDNIGVDVSIKLRLSNLGQSTIFYYTNLKDSIIPYGHTVKETGKGVVWLDGLESISNTTLGISNLKIGVGGAWLRLPSETSIEYELFDSSTAANERHSQTVFIKTAARDKIIEVVSDFYTVPNRPSK